MFRLFLRKKILSAPGQPRLSDEAPKRNRRVFARYSVDHKHLTLMNEQDILLVREISAKGFSTEVSPRGFERLTPGDVYDARIRYRGEIYALQARVAWKDGTFVGFEIMEASREAMLFIKRLLRPVEIASSLQPVESAFMNEGPIGKTWYHGDEESDLFTWHHPDTNELKAWQLAVGNDYVEWTENRGLSTGSLTSAEGRAALLGGNLQSLQHAPDETPDLAKRQLAVDIVMALQQPVREEILETL